MPLGLVSWLLAGLALGALARRLPGPRRPSLGEDLTLGVAGAVAGGLLATALGFGGLLGYDPRALWIAASSAMIALVWLHIARLPKPR